MSLRPGSAEVVRLNHAALARALDWLAAHAPQGRPRVLLISPNRADVLFLRRRQPRAELTIVTIAEWNLDDPPALGVGPFDWAIASNVMHYARTPNLWIKHVMMISQCFVIQDLIDRRRGPAPLYLAADGDAMRYCHSGQQVGSSFVGAFDLAGLAPPPVYFEAFTGAGNDYHAGIAAPRHFCAVLMAAPSQGIARPPRRALSALGYRLRLLCFEHWPLYAAYKVVGRMLGGSLGRISGRSRR